MFEALVVAAGAGFLLGLRYRPPAVVVASAAAAVMGPALAYLTGSSFRIVLLASVGAMVALQCGYLGGSLLNFSLTRTTRPRSDVDTPDGCLAAKEWGGPP
ncbi:MAG TPA: hypothetical protein VH913_08070 [Hyphomicrobiaceae bacterium]|jgi:hypothetical protein